MRNGPQVRLHYHCLTPPPPTTTTTHTPLRIVMIDTAGQFRNNWPGERRGRFWKNKNLSGGVFDDDDDDDDDDVDADCFYIVLFSALEQTLRSHVILHEWLAFYSAFLNIHRNDVLKALAWLVPRETAAFLSAQVLCTPYNHAPCHFMQSHIRKVYECLAVTCHLHFWQNDLDLLRATAVTRGWNGYRTNSQNRKLILEKKIVPPLLQGFEPANCSKQMSQRRKRRDRQTDRDKQNRGRENYKS